MIQRATQLLLVAIVCGASFLGIGGRVAMRALALAAGRPTNFGIGATMGIVFIGTALGLVGGIVFVIVSGHLRGSAPIKGLLFGTLFLAVLIPLQPAAVQEEIAAFEGHLLLATMSFWLLFAGYGLTLATILARLNVQPRSAVPT
jgi:hypothetical protein